MNPANEKKKYADIWILLGLLCVAAIAVVILCGVSASRLPDGIGDELSPAKQAEIIERNSPLTSYINLTENADFPREDTIRKITIHHMAGNLSLEKVGEIFFDQDRRVSANYAIDNDGNVGLYVEECNRAWSSSSKENDGQAVTIEVANDQIGDDWHVSDTAYEALIDLCTDICLRNGIEELVYTGDETGSLTTHNMFYKDTECPGPYLARKMGDIADAVNRRLAASDNA